MRKVSTWYRHDLEHSNLKPTLHWSSLIIFNQKFKSRLYHNCSKPECNQSLTFVSWRHWRCKSSPALFFFKHLGGIVSCAQITQTIWGSPTFACWNSTSKSCNASQPNREITVLFSEGGGRAVEGSKLVEARNGLDPMTGKGQCRNGLERLERGSFFLQRRHLFRSVAKSDLFLGNVQMKKGWTYHFRKHPNNLEIPTAPEPAAVVWPKRCSRSNTTMAAWNDGYTRAMVTVVENLPSNSHVSTENAQLKSWILF